MITINLRDFYKDHYHRDCFVDVPEKVAKLLAQHKREDESHLRKQNRRKKLVLSLDYGDGIEHQALFLPISAEKMYYQQMKMLTLNNALTQLPETQARRIYAYYILNVTKAKIAESEGVSERSLCPRIHQPGIEAA